MSENTSTKEITNFTAPFFLLGGAVIFFLPTWKVVPGAYSDQRETTGDTWNTPKKCFFSDRKRPKEGERVALGHFHERVGESPRREKNFGTSGSKIRCFVSEIWPFEVGIRVTAARLITTRFTRG